MFNFDNVKNCAHETLSIHVIDEAIEIYTGGLSRNSSSTKRNQDSRHICLPSKLLDFLLLHINAKEISVIKAREAGRLDALLKVKLYKAPVRL